MENFTCFCCGEKLLEYNYYECVPFSSCVCVCVVCVCVLCVLCVWCVCVCVCGVCVCVVCVCVWCVCVCVRVCAFV
jgi:hypothetical protein